MVCYHRFCFVQQRFSHVDSSDKRHFSLCVISTICFCQLQFKVAVADKVKHCQTSKGFPSFSHVGSCNSALLAADQTDECADILTHRKPMVNGLPQRASVKLSRWTFDSQLARSTDNCIVLGLRTNHPREPLVNITAPYGNITSNFHRRSIQTHLIKVAAILNPNRPQRWLRRYFVTVFNLRDLKNCYHIIQPCLMYGLQLQRGD